MPPLASPGATGPNFIWASPLFCSPPPIEIGCCRFQSLYCAAETRVYAVSAGEGSGVGVEEWSYTVPRGTTRHPDPPPQGGREKRPRLSYAIVLRKRGRVQRGRETQRGGNLCHDGDRNLGRRHRPDAKTDRRMDARERGLGHALRLEPLQPARVGLFRAERPNIEAVARKRMEQRRIVDFGIMGQRRECGVAVDAERWQRLIGPLRD